MSRRAHITYADNDRRVGARPFICELETGWRGRLATAAGAALILVVWALCARGRGAWALALFGVLLFLVYAAWVALSCRAWLEVTDELTLRTRRFFAWHNVSAESVHRVREVVAGRSPDVRLDLDRGSVVVPTSRLRAGHRILFVWLADCAPQASYDAGATRIRDMLAADGWPVGQAAQDSGN